MKNAQKGWFLRTEFLKKVPDNEQKTVTGTEKVGQDCEIFEIARGEDSRTNFNLEDCKYQSFSLRSSR